MSFAGFSEEDLHRMKYPESGTQSGPYLNNTNVKKIDKLGIKAKKTNQPYKSSTLQTQNSDDIIDSLEFDKCKLSLKSPTSSAPVGIEDMVNNNKNVENVNKTSCDAVQAKTPVIDTSEIITDVDNTNVSQPDYDTERRKSVITPDVVKCLDNYTEDVVIAHTMKLDELQLKQKLMEEQNKKRKEMLAKALADRTKQTEEEVQKLEKIKKELQVLDGQFSIDVAVLRKKIDLASQIYSDAEKHYLRVEKDFLQAKINLQKQKEKKELLIEHLCALITHNETRKAEKLETLMLELAINKKDSVNDVSTPADDNTVIIDGVDERTGKMVELPTDDSTVT